MPVSSSSYRGLLHDAGVSPRTGRGGISFEVSPLAYFSELLDELVGVDQELEAEGIDSPLQVRQGNITTRIEDRLINKNIRSGRLQRRSIVVGEDDDETESQPSTRSRRIFSFPTQANRTRAFEQSSSEPNYHRCN